MPKSSPLQIPTNVSLQDAMNFQATALLALLCYTNPDLQMHETAERDLRAALRKYLNKENG